MAIESVELNSMAGGSKVAVDTVDTDKQVQYMKLMDGTDGSATVIAGGANGLKVDLTSTGSNTNKILVTPDLPSGAATSAKQLADGHNVVVASGTVTAVTSITNAVAVTNAGITTIAGAVAGTEMQVDVLTMPTTTVQATHLDVRHLNSTDDTVNAVCTNAGTFAVQAATTVSATRVQGNVTNHTDTTTAREVLAAIASNYVYITSFIISVATAGSYWLEDGDAAQITPKFILAANGGVSWTSVGNTPFKTTTVNKAINVKGSTSGAVGVMLTGYSSTT